MIAHKGQELGADAAPTQDRHRLPLVNDPGAIRGSWRGASAFRQDIQDEIIARLGLVRTQDFLRVLMAHCQEAAAAIVNRHGDLDRIIHDLASTSGMLGFEDVSLRCRDVLLAPDAAMRAKALGPLKASLAHAIILLREQTIRIEAAA